MKNQDKTTPQVPQPNKPNMRLVKKMHDALVKEYQKIVRQYGPFSITDIILSTHNFHKNVIIDLEARADDRINSIRNTAVTTFSEGLLPTPVEPEKKLEVTPKKGLELIS